MSATIGYAPPAFAATITLDLSKNEGRPPRTVASAELSAGDIARYPDLADLRDAMAATFGVSVAHLLVTAGGDDALLRLCLLALRREGRAGPARRAVVAVPTFEMIPRYVELAGGELVAVAWPSGAFPVDALLAAVGDGAAIVFVVSPNNPTGAVATADDLRRIANALPDTLVVLDAAYAEFADEDLMVCARQLANVVVVRTLSKAWGLAGLRVGCAIASPELIDKLYASGNPMPVSVATAAIAVARLRSDRDEVLAHVAWLRRRRDDLVALLQRLGLTSAQPCQGNFVLVTGVDPLWFASSLAALGIAVRRFHEQRALADAVRITVPPTETAFEQLEAALTTVVAPTALLFDMDGVLADVSQSYRTAIVRTAASYGVAVTAEDIAAAKRRGNANDDWQVTRSLLADRGVVLPLAAVTERFEGFYAELRDRERLLVCRERLRAWQQRFRLGVVTGRPREQAEFFLERVGIRDLFDVVVCREDAALKPDPAPVQLALGQLGVSSAWMLGDTVDDLVAARRAGVLPIGIGSELDGASAACVLAQADDLEELL